MNRNAAFLWLAAVAMVRAEGAEPFLFTPEPSFSPQGSVSVRLMENIFQTNPLAGKPRTHAPALVRTQISASDDIALQLDVGERVGFGGRARLWGDKAHGFQLSMGLDEILTSSDAYLFGIEASEGAGELEDRLTLLLAREHGWGEWRLGMAALARYGSGTRYVPSLALKVDLPFHAAVGWEGWLQHSSLRQSLGLSWAWKPVTFAVGLSELQSWLMRKGKWGWYGSPPEDARDGENNSGLWMSLAVEFAAPVRHRESCEPVVVALPRFTEFGPGGASGGGTISDSALAQNLFELSSRRQVRRDLAELAVRIRGSAANPQAAQILRRQILSMGLVARQELGRVVQDRATSPEERRQALISLGEGFTASEIPVFMAAASDPEAMVRMEAAVGLRNLGGLEVAAVLQQLQQDPDPSVRLAAGGSLGNAPVPPAPPALQELPAPTPSPAPMAPTSHKPVPEGHGKHH